MYLLFSIIMSKIQKINSILQIKSAFCIIIDRYPWLDFW